MCEIQEKINFTKKNSLIYYIFQDSHEFDRRWFEFLGRDCVNGTLMPRKHLPSLAANFTLIHQIFARHGISNKLDGDEEKIPYETDITIYNKTKVRSEN